MGLNSVITFEVSHTMRSATTRYGITSKEKSIQLHNGYFIQEAQFEDGCFNQL